MAKKTVTYCYSDLSGAEIDSGDAAISFGLEGHTYEVDLTASEVQVLRKLLAPYVAVARTTGAPSQRRTNSASNGSARVEASPKAIREWAEANGYEVPARGRIPALVREAFDIAH